MNFKMLLEALMLACGATEEELPLLHAELENLGIPTTAQGMLNDVRAALQRVRN